ncbi:autotransporter domain-containing protein, partial [Bordetella avium]
GRGGRGGGGGGAADLRARLNSSVTVASGASIGGFGTVNGNVVVQAGGSLAPGAPGGTFVVNGDLTLAQGSAMDFSFGQPGSSGAAGAGHSVQVNGSLALNGVRLSVNDAGGYGVGVYRLFDYTGSLTTGNGGFTGLAVGQTVQVYNGQINLINARNLTLNLWNADRTATATQQGGGSGVWSKNSANWTDVDVTVTSAFSPSNAFAIFGGTAGTVTVDGSAGNVSTSGAQFLSDGYRLNGDALNLVAPSAGALSEVRVGDGSAASADWTATLDTVVAGNGLDKTGLGTLVLNGTNTYAQTRLSAGTLPVSSDANLGAASGGLDFQGGTLRVTGTAFESTARAITLGAAGGGLDIADAGNTFTVSQALSGNGGLAKLGAGALVLTGSNTYQGTTTVSAGRLQVGDGVTQGSIAGDADIQAGGTLAFKRIDQVVYGGAISGSGQLRQEGSGTLVLTGDSAFTGTTTIASGSLQVGDGGNRGTLGGTIINNGNLTFNRATDSVFAGVLAGGGAVSKLGAGVLTLTGDSSAYTGATSLLAGGLQVDGKLGGALWVATSGAMLLASAPSATPLAPTSDATVSGTGSLQDLIVGSGGTLAPGNAATPFGQLSVLGNLVMLPGASYRVAAAADGQHSRVKVTGVANVAGSVLHMGQNGSYAPSTTYTILSADGGVQGRFDSVSSNLAFLTPSLAYGSKQVDLTVQRKQVPDGGGGTRPIEFADAAFTGNQRSVARALQSLSADSALFRRVLNLPNGVPAEVFNGLSGEAHASTVSMAQGVANSFVQIPLNRLRANLGAGMLPGVPTAQLGLGSAAALPQSAAQPLWAQVFGNWGSVRGNGNAARTTQSDNGVSAGGDVAVGAGWRLGGAAGYSNSRSRTSDRASNSQADSYSLTVYGGKAFDAGSAKLNLSLGASYTWHDMKTQRYADAAGLPQTLKADYKGNTSQVFGELGYAMPLTERVTLEPFVGAGFSSLRTGAFSESGGDAALRGEANRNNVTTTTLGLHARQAFESAGAQGQLFGTLGWRHAFGDVDPSSTMSFVQGGASFTTNGAPIARDTALVELGVNMAVSKRTTVGVIYGGQFGEGSQQHSGTLDVRYRF